MFDERPQAAAAGNRRSKVSVREPGATSANRKRAQSAYTNHAVVDYRWTAGGSGRYRRLDRMGCQSACTVETFGAPGRGSWAACLTCGLHGGIERRYFPAW